MRAFATFQMSGAVGMPQLSVDMMNSFDARQRACAPFWSATFVPCKPGTTILLGLRRRF